jgi:lysyl oxidase-like protein 2/3/4
VPKTDSSGLQAFRDDGGLTTEALGTSTPALKEQYDVIVVGAGFAGLTAARNLTASRHLSVLFVEARGRVGSRTCTAEERVGEYKIGGQWVHG